MEHKVNFKLTLQEFLPQRMCITLEKKYAGMRQIGVILLKLTQLNLGCIPLHLIF